MHFVSKFWKVLLYNICIRQLTYKCKLLRLQAKIKSSVDSMEGRISFGV